MRWVTESDAYGLNIRLLLDISQLLWDCSPQRLKMTIVRYMDKD